MRVVFAIPFRDTPGQNRAAQLDIFEREMRALCDAHKVKFEFCVGEHLMDGNKFNRGQCINAVVSKLLGTLDMDKTMIVMHDVDIIPSEKHFADVYLPLFSEDVSIIHLASAWTKYNYRTFLGGALAIRGDLFLRVGGMPHQFFGWGGEDDGFAIRIKRHRLFRLMSHKRDKDPTAFRDLELSDYKLESPKDQWYNQDKRSNIASELESTHDARVLWRRATQVICIVDEAPNRVSFVLDNREICHEAHEYVGDRTK
jgi:hypothetical protein